MAMFFYLNYLLGFLTLLRSWWFKFLLLDEFGTLWESSDISDSPESSKSIY